LTTFTSFSQYFYSKNWNSILSQEATYNLEIVKEYKRLSEENDSQKISFYKKNERFFDLIPINKKIEIVHDFMQALFHNGEYNEYLSRCDAIVESLFDSRLFPEFPRAKLIDLLYMKACCQFYTHDTGSSILTLKGLVAMDNGESLKYQDLMFRILLRRRSLKRFQARGLVIAFILTSAVLSIWTVLFVRQVKPELVNIYQYWTLGIFLVGIGIWIGFRLWNYYQSYSQAKAFVKEGQS